MEPQSRRVTEIATAMYAALVSAVESRDAHFMPGKKSAEALAVAHLRVEETAFAYMRISEDTPLGQRLRRWMIDESFPYPWMSVERAVAREQWAAQGGFVDHLDFLVAVGRGEIAEEYALELMK